MSCIVGLSIFYGKPVLKKSPSTHDTSNANASIAILFLISISLCTDQKFQTSTQLKIVVAVDIG